MSALIGFSKPNIETEAARQTLGDMADMVLQSSTQKTCVDHIFIDSLVAATRTHESVLQPQPQPFRNKDLDGIFVWLDGEFYNRDEVAKHYNCFALSDPELLAKLYQQDTEANFLREIDGIFSAVIYDTPRQTVHVLNDRYGLKQLCWTILGESLFWASEIKALLNVPNFSPRINWDAVRDFFEKGYLTGQSTWFADVNVLPSGTILSWKPMEKKVSLRRYWWWDEINKIRGPIKERELINELGHLFEQAVKRRFDPDERIGILLSGGLDSRAILAATPSSQKPLHAVTFGRTESIDVKYAASAAKLKGAKHHIFEINESNWLKRRFSTIWNTDGQLNLMHMHGIEEADRIGQLFDINLHGFLGDAILGGTYVDRGGGRQAMIASIDNSGRRFVALGPQAASRFYKPRFPFFDNELMAFAFSIPENLQAKSTIYKKMLLATFPDYYRNIPWQKTGVTIDKPSWVQDASQYVNAAKGKLASKISHKFDQRRFTNYPLWIRQDPCRSLFEKILFNSNAIYPEYLSADLVRGWWDDHMQGKNFSNELCSVITLEVWLQQAFEGEWRTVD